jgi:hypothetical protein
VESRTPKPGRVKGADAKIADNRVTQKAGSEWENVPPPLSANPDLPEQDDEPEKFPVKVGRQRELPECSERSGITGSQLEDYCRRLDGYAEGCFSHGKPWEMMARLKEKMQRKTRYSWDHIDRATRAWMQWTANFKFSRHRFGRSTCIVITQKRRPLVLSREEVCRRLVGAIRNYVAQSGRVHVDRKFLENFHARYGLPAEAILSAWRSIYRIEGLVCRWKGKGNGRKLYVQTPPAARDATAARQKPAKFSPRQNASGISPLRGKDRKTPATPEGFQSGSSSSAASQAWSGVAGRELGRETHSARSPPTDGKDDQSRSGNGPSAGAIPKPLGNDPLADHWPAAWKPLHVCDRWIGPAKLAGKTNLIVFRILAPMHETFRLVEWRQGYAWKFAAEAIASGFLDCEICAAYRTGLEQSQRDVMREDGAPRLSGRAREDGSWETLWVRDPRVPSQAISIAWNILRADERSDEERWSAIFRGDVTPAGAALKPVRTPAPKPARPRAAAELPTAPAPGRTLQVGDLLRHRETGVETRVRYVSARGFSTEDDRDNHWNFRHLEQFSITPRKSANKIAAEKKPTFDATTTPALARQIIRLDLGVNPTFEEHMKARGLDVGALLKLSRAEQQKFVREALKTQRDNSQKG